MRKKRMAVISVALCFCLVLGVFAGTGGLSALATALNIATTKVTDLKEKTNTSAALGTEENPFTILEIVPSREQSQIGYYFPGCEPISMEKAKYSQSAKQKITDVMSDLYTILEQTEYAFYDQIPSAGTNENLTVYTQGLSDAQKTRTDVNFSDTYSEYGQWRAAPANVSFSQTGEYVDEGEGGGCFASADGTTYTYVGEGQGRYKWIASQYGATVRSANNDVYLYTYVSYTHKDTFVEQVFEDISGTFTTQVLTLTPAELDYQYNREWIDKVDMIVIHGASSDYSDLAALYYECNENGDTDSGTGAAAPTFWDVGKDLTDNAYLAILDRMASANPCALLLDESALTADTQARAETNCGKLLDEVRDIGGDKLLTYDGSRAMTALLNDLSEIKPLLEQPEYMPKLRVLELEGCEQYIYGSTGWEDYYQALFPWYSPATDNPDGWLHDTDLIEITTMPTYEFIGSTGQYDYDEMNLYGNATTLTTESSDDLLAKYDLIIIGSKQDASNGLNGYNMYQNGNEATNGGTKVDLGKLVYTSIGGSVGTDKGMVNRIATAMNIHYSGNDITLKKMLELEDFLKAGKPIVVDTGLYKNGAVDTTKVDKSSKLYDLLTWDGDGTGAEANLFVSGSVNSDQMKSLIQDNGCRLVFYDGGYPTEYNYTTEDKTVTYNGSSKMTVSGVINSEIYQSKQSTGEAVLTYHFYIEGNTSDTYNVYLNIDLNGDGVYSGSLKEHAEVDNMNVAMGLSGDDAYTYDTTESAMGLTIYDRNMNKLGTTNPEDPASGYALSANTEYYATRTIPSAQQGIVPWKLEVQSRTNSSLRSSAVDYTAIYNAENKKSITVLQMSLSTNMNTNTANLFSRTVYGSVNAFTAFTDERIVVNANDTYATFKARMTATADGEHMLPATETTSMNSKFSANQKMVVKKFQTYLEPVQEFDVEIQFLYSSDWYKLFRTGNNEQDIANWEDFLSNYDMIVLGFVDGNCYTNDPVYHAGVQDFIDQGKSMILSHDTVAGADMASNVYTTNATWLRTIAGQRRAYYNKQADGSYAKSYTAVEANGTTVNFVTQFAKNSLTKYLGNYSESLFGGTDTTTYQVNEFPDNDLYILMNYYSIYNNVDHVTKPGAGTFVKSNVKTRTTYVELTNNGQITSYPYRLNSVIEVMATHMQNYQLDLEYEDGGDVNVWFNMTDQYDPDVKEFLAGETASSEANNYSSKEQDSRNSYYIYNKGNITYTGSGHGVPGGTANVNTNAKMTDDEVKLFVNTMIAAYRQPESEPTVTLDDPDGTDGEGRSLLYLDYDGVSFDTYTDADGNTAGGGTKNSLDSRVELVDGKEMVAIYFSVYDIGSSTLEDKKSYLTIDSAANIADSDLLLKEITTADGATVMTELTPDADGVYTVDSTADGAKYVLYFPYSKIRDSSDGACDFTFTTYATYTKKNRDITTTEKSTTAEVLLLPLFDLE